MLKLSRSFLSAFFCILFMNSAFSFLPPTEKDGSGLPRKEVEKADELQRRKEIAKDYLSTLDKVKEDWIDPYQMISCKSKECLNIVEKRENVFNAVTQTSTDGEKNSNSATEPEIDNMLNEVTVGHQLPTNKPLVKGKAESSRNNLYFSRWVKKLLLLIEKENIDESSLISFSLNEDVLNHLKELSHAEKLEIFQVDELVANLLNNAFISKKREYDWTDLLDYYKYIVWGIAAGSVTLFLLYLFYISSVNHPYLTSFFMLLASAVFWHWMHLFQQRVAFKQAELSSMNIPRECRKHDFGFFEHIQEYFKSFFKTNGCVKYHEALAVDPFWEVSITVAISEAFAAFIFQPLSTGSHILNKSLKHLFDELSVEIKIFLIVFILLVLVMKCNYRIKLPYFMGVIEPVHPVGSSVQNVQPTKSILESSKDRVGNVIKFVQGEDKMTVEKRGEYDMLPHSDNESTKCVRKLSERVQTLAGPRECHTCGCSSKPTWTVKEKESVTQIINECEASTSGNFASETDSVCFDQPADNSIKILCRSPECVHSEKSSCNCHTSTESVDTVAIPN